MIAPEHHRRAQIFEYINARNHDKLSDAHQPKYQMPPDVLINFEIITGSRIRK